MAGVIIEKLTNFFMAPEEMLSAGESEQAGSAGRESHLRLHKTTKSTDLTVVVCSPTNFDDVCLYADYLKMNTAIILNFESAETDLQRRIGDFLDGVCMVTGGSMQQISDSLVMYAPAGVAFSKDLYGYSVPTYVKSSNM
ncbi:MAG: Cell division protein sepF [Firmicutes bacterium]|nr:Cell division protein sepF [Bacillota bacterium]